MNQSYNQPYNNLELHIELKKKQIELVKLQIELTSVQTRKSHGDFFNWCNSHVIKDSDCVLKTKDIRDGYGNYISCKYKDFDKLVEKYFKETYNTICLQHKTKDGRPKGYLGFTLRVVE